jgi:O-antigen ligase
VQIEIDRLQQRDLIAKIPVLLLLLAICTVTAVSVVNSPYLVISLLLGSPALLLVATEKKKFTALLIIFALAPFMGIVKTFTGVRYAPLMLDIALWFLFTFCILSRIITSRLKLSSLGVLILLFIGLSAVQMFNPNIHGLVTGLEGFRPYYQAFGFFTGIWLIKSKRQVRQFLLTLCCSSLLVAAYGMKQFFYPTSIDLKVINMSTASSITFTALGQMRAFSTMSSPFHLGMYMVMMILLMVALFQQKKRQGYLFFAIAVYLVTIFLTLTRSSWIGLFGALAFYIFLLFSERRSRLTVRAIAIVGGFIFGIAWFAQTHPYFSVISDYFTSLGTITETTHFQGRIEGWMDTTLPAIMRNPFVGYGTGSALDSFSHRSIYLTKFTSHSLYLKYAIEMGIGGLVLFLLILITSLKHGIKAYLQLKDIYLKSLAGWILTFIVAVSISGLSGPMLDAYPVNLYFWFLLGLLFKLKDIEKEPETSSRVG